MKCEVFIGPWNQVMDAFNKWAKGKLLTKEVVIHTNALAVYKAGEYSGYICITVYHPEDPFWDKAVE